MIQDQEEKKSLFKRGLDVIQTKRQLIVISRGLELETSFRLVKSRLSPFAASDDLGGQIEVTASNGLGAVFVFSFSFLFTFSAICLHCQLFIYIVSCLFTFSAICLYFQLFVYIIISAV